MTTTTDPFATPGTASGVQWEDLKGALLLIEPHTVETGIQTTFGEKDAIRADVAVLDGPSKGEQHPDTLVFPGVLISQLKTRLGQKVLGRLGQGQGKPGQKPPWILTEATDADKQIGLAYLANGFATPDDTKDQPPF